MGRKAGSRQLKRQPSPAFWPIHRKEETWAPMPRPGPHARQKSLPLVLILRNILGYARTSNEAKGIIKSGQVKVDGVTRRDHRLPIGLMDVVQIQGGGTTEIFRILPKRGGGLQLTPITPEESKFKLCKITGKHTVKNGGRQLGLHDGRTILYGKEQKQRTAGEVTVGSSLQLSLPDQKVIRIIPFQPGAIALVTDGRNQGAYGKLAQVKPGTFARRKMVRLEAENEAFETPADYVMPIGAEMPLVKLG
ncbi:MAG TPA: 30S ribosomal protein S4e [Candidatus Binatus sp.]|nr:30S ribosomal protein S4e [Candidatus Binatus sp.]